MVIELKKQVINYIIPFFHKVQIQTHSVRQEFCHYFEGVLGKNDNYFCKIKEENSNSKSTLKIVGLHSQNTGQPREGLPTTVLGASDK